MNVCSWWFNSTYLHKHTFVLSLKSRKFRNRITKIIISKPYTEFGVQEPYLAASLETLYSFIAWSVYRNNFFSSCSNPTVDLKRFIHIMQDWNIIPATHHTSHLGTLCSNNDTVCTDSYVFRTIKKPTKILYLFGIVAYFALDKPALYKAL